MEAILGHVHALVAFFVSAACADTLVTDMNLLDPACSKLAISKALGYAVVLGAVIVKVPQIVIIIQQKSAKGVSLMATLQELLTYSITLSRSYRRDLPFSTWGESLFITVQLVALVVLIMMYNEQKMAIPVMLVGLASLFYVLLSPELVSDDLQTQLQGLTVPIMVISRLTQIRTIVRDKATGSLSPVTSLLNAVGSAARVFTTLQEVQDTVLLVSFLMGTTLNVAVSLLFLVYPKTAAEAQEQKAKKTK